MKFARKPLVGSVRKRFAWLPRKQFEMRAQMVAIPGAVPIPYEQGWSHSLQFSSMPAPPSHRYPGGKPAVKTNRNGGMVTQVIPKAVNWYDHWIWFEYYLQHTLMDHGTRNGRTAWHHYPMPEQWNLWHEYD